MDEFRKMFGNLTDEEYERMRKKSQKEYTEKQARKVNSPFHCRIPDWTEQGGMVEFWINEDNSFECEDSRISDSNIRDGLLILANLGHGKIDILDIVSKI